MPAKCGTHAQQFVPLHSFMTMIPGLLLIQFRKQMKLTLNAY